MCVDGRCEPDFCADVACPAGQECIEGSCVDDSCGGVTCELGYECINGTCIFDPCGYVECPPGESCVLDTRGEAQCVGAWTDPPQSDENPEDPMTAGTEVEEGMSGTMIAGEGFTPEMPAGEKPEDGEEGMQSAESVSGCHQNKQPFPLTWTALLVLLGLVRGRASRELI